MSSSTKLLRLPAEDVARALVEARTVAERDEASEMVLDFAGVRRLDTAAVTEMAALVDTASRRELPITARAVSVGVYKVLKLSGIAERIGFMND